MSNLLDMLHLFDQKYSKKYSNILKYYYNLNSKMWFIPVMTKLNFLQPLL